MQQTSTNGDAVQKANPPDAKQMLSAKTMSIADQLAMGLLTAGEHLQAGCLTFCALCCAALCAHWASCPLVPFAVLPFVPIGLPALCAIHCFRLCAH